MSRYSIVHNDTGEIVREVTSEQLQRANELLKANKRPYGHVKPSTYKRQTIGQAAESWWQSLQAAGGWVTVVVGLVLVLAVVS